MKQVKNCVWFALFISLFFCQNNILAQGPFECNGQYYLTINPASESIIYEVQINPLNGNIDFVEVGTQGTGQNINALGYRSTDNFMYAINPNTNRFYRIGNDGVAVFITTLDLSISFRYYGAAITPDGSTMIFIGTTNFNASRSLAFVDLDTYETVKTLDLTDVSTGNPSNIVCTDIGIHPLTGDLYGFDIIRDRVVRFDTNTGVVSDDIYPTSNVADRMGAVFFDPFGTMYGYDRTQTGNVANTLFQIDLADGSIAAVAQGPIAQDKDGCSCPYTVQLQKTVEPTITLACTEVTYYFTVANSSSQIQTGITFEDQMPEGFVITGIESNPFGGEILEGIGSNVLSIIDMTLPPGKNELVVTVAIGEDLAGIYQNQAVLSELPESLGGAAFSDNPSTVILYDSTNLEVVPLEINFLSDTSYICEGDLLPLDATALIENGVSYNWSTGEMEALIEVEMEGEYVVTVSGGCETIVQNVTVIVSENSLELGENITINLGDSIQLLPEVITPVEYAFTWNDPLENTLSCTDCWTPFAMPYFDNLYGLSVLDDNGCEAVDSIFIEVVKDYSVYIPNAFSPNFDGLNDYFYPLTPTDQRLLSFSIFDRWGNQVFESENGFTNQADYGWDGTFRGKDMNPAVFVYLATVEYLDGHQEVLSGDVTLLR